MGELQASSRLPHSMPLVSFHVHFPLTIAKTAIEKTTESVKIDVLGDIYQYSEMDVFFMRECLDQRKVCPQVRRPAVSKYQGEGLKAVVSDSGRILESFMKLRLTKRYDLATCCKTFQNLRGFCLLGAGITRHSEPIIAFTKFDIHPLLFHLVPCDVMQSGYVQIESET